VSATYSDNEILIISLLWVAEPHERAKRNSRQEGPLKISGT
jgi:hypothetical protein